MAVSEFVLRPVSPDISVARHDAWDRAALRAEPGAWDDIDGPSYEWWLNAEQLRRLAGAALAEALRLETRHVA